MKTIEKFLSEAKKKDYPSQQDGEYLIAYMKAVNSLSQGGISSEMSKLHNTIMTIHMPLWKKVFGDKSPWSVGKVRGIYSKVVWNKSKAKSLGLDE